MLHLGVLPTDQISCWFQLPVIESEIETEKFFAKDSIFRSYSFRLDGGRSFTRGSQTYFLISSVGADLANAQGMEQNV